MEQRIIHENSLLVTAMRKAAQADSAGRQAYESMERARSLLADPQQLGRLCSACFWASMETEEARPVRGTLVACSPHPSLAVRVLSDPVPVGISTLVSLLTASPRAPLAVHGGASGLHVWGMLDAEPQGLVRLRIAGNGSLLASQSERVLAVYHKGVMSRPKAADGQTLLRLMSDALGKRRVEFDSEMATRLIRMVTTMIGHGHGGTLVVVDPDDDSWQQAVRFKFSFRVPHEEGEARLQAMSQALLQRIGELSLIDGAVLVDTDWRLYGFGARLEIGHSDPGAVALNAVSGRIREGLSVSELGGMRHQSAAHFVGRHHAADVFVVSQDGRLSLFCWSNTHICIAVVQNLEHFLWEHA